MTRDETGGSTKTSIFVRDFLQFSHFVASKSTFSYEFSLERENLLLQNPCFVPSFRQFSTHRTKCHACHGMCTLSSFDAALPMRFAINTQHDTSKVLRLPRKMTMDTSKVLRLPRKMQHIFWIRCKSIAPATQNDFRHVTNTSECYEVPRLPRKTKQRNVGNLKNRHGHIAITRTVADGCGRLQTVAGRLRPWTQRLANTPPDPQSETGTLATHSGKRREKKRDKHRNQRRESKGDKHRNPSRNQEEPANHDETEPLSWGKKEERRRETSTGTKEERRRETRTGTTAGTKRNQQIMMEQNPFPEERKKREGRQAPEPKKREEGRQAPEPKKREEGRQAPEPQPEPRGISRSWWNRTPCVRKERRENKGDTHWNPSQNQEEPANHDGTEPLSWGKKQKRRRETSTGTKEERRRGDKHRNPSRNQEEPANHDGTEPLSWGKKEERRRETSAGTKGEKKGDKHRNPSRNQEEPANHDGTEPLSWGKKEERRRETNTGTKEERRRETSTGTPAGTRKNQQITMEQKPFPEERKKREEGRQAPEPQPEPRGISRSWWNRTPCVRKERRENKGDTHWNPSQNQEEPANHDGTEPLSWGKKEKRRRETSTGTKEERRRGDKHRNPSRNQEEPANYDGTEHLSWGKKREEGRQAPEPQQERGGASKSWGNNGRL